MPYRGSCHCGRVAFEVQGDIDSGLDCNCSMCRRKGALLWFVPRTRFTLSTPEDAASTYRFNTHTIAHRFCPACGIHPYGEAVNPRTGEPTVAVNLRCLDGVDLGQVKIVPFDGASR